ncbi:Detected protein of confused Function [Hibiscus syriacus]|uniref:Detected protein of confused Function n=1 Tax=Hibiscus syriacus TaxID=106335 RepID=A0A6A3CUJ2_HIBSY|nr:F-box protein At5g49610-like [Hibiscus syriacus]KAE8732177.1 Detected protein of confused Function [Hibiscus syriacus]
MDETGGECVYQDKWYDVDVLFNILSRLPIESILVCKFVCKHWRRLISCQAFIDEQLLWSRKNSIYLVYPFMDVMLELYFVKSSGEIAKTMNFPYCDNFSPITFVCSFDGLLCCINYPWKVDLNRVVEDETDLEIRFCNHVTRKALLIPKGSPSKEKPSIGVAFGPKINEYKIFRFFSAKRISLAKQQSRVNRGQCEVYSSSTRSWSVMGRVTFCPMHPRHSCLGSTHVFVNGTIYWFIASDEDQMIPGSILTIDIEETFGRINLPMDVTEHSYLVDLKGCLSLVTVHDEDEIMDIWILEDKNEPKWELKCSDQVPLSNDECVEFVVARENDIFVIASKHYYIYDSDHKVWRKLDISMAFEMNFPVAFTYTESFLSSVVAAAFAGGGRIEYISDERSI